MTSLRFYLCFTLSYALAALTLLGAALGSAWVFLGAASVFVLHPLLDNLILKSWRLPETRPESNVSLAILIFALPFLCVFGFVGIIHATTATTLELVGLIISFGTILGVLGINTAHELVHRKEKSLQNIGFALLSLANFSHYGIEHVFGHHKNVGTPLDPATAKKNEWIYTYFLRSYFWGFVDALKLEHKRLRSKGFWHPLKSRVLLWGAFQLFINFCIYALFGKNALLFWLGQSFVAVLLLQTVDYIEHYGLLRKEKEGGGYEGVKAEHSWDCYQALSNYTLINLGFHAHHHLKATVPFYQLTEQEKAPQMPYGYSAMALMALVPPVYFRVMNPRIPQTVRNNTDSSSL
ncbi:MAG TPA: alkane 1-monooxygenase [Bdellovibrio sp.]